MSYEADLIVDRRRMRRKLTFWRVSAAVLAVAIVLGLALLATPAARRGFGIGTTNSIARITIEGLITSNNERVQALDRLGRSSARAVIIHVNSPGGTTAGSEQLYDALTRLRAKKPVVVVVDGLCASGAYIAALSADHIVAQSTSLVGSIGVLVQFPNVGDLMKTIGVKVEEVKSSPLKAAPNGFEPTSPEARAALDDLVKDSYAWFKDLVKTRRGMDDPMLEKVADGRIFTGRQAVPLKLVDELGGETAAVAWLATEKKISASTPVRDYRLAPRFSDMNFLRLATSMTLEAVGLDGWAQRLAASGTIASVDRLGLEGLLALWQPGGTN
jgi:protease-4